MIALSSAVVSAIGKVNVLPGTALALPAGCKVKVRWVIPPLSAKAVDEANWYDLRFAVDSAGRPWFAAGYDRLINPTRQYQFKLQCRCEDIACLENGVFLVANTSDLGLVVPPETPNVSYDGFPTALFQPISGLPLPECKLYPGAGNCLYLTGRNPASEKYKVYLLGREKLSTHGSGVREYVKVFSSENEIQAVAGDGNTTYVAIDRVIMKTSRSGGAPVKVFTHPTELISGLAYSPQSGLIYSSDNSVGRVGAHGTLQMLAGPEPRIYLQKGSLYVLFPKSLGVLALDNISDLKRFDKAIKEVPATQSKEAKVTGIRFFEAGETPPEYADRKYVKEFDKASTRYIYCQVDMTNLLKGKRASKQLISMELLWPGGASYIDTAETTLDFRPDLAGAWAWLRFGSETPGSFYPGKYTLKTYLNGSKIDERRFTVSGEADVLEAAWNGDSARMWKLLDAGADPNVVNSGGQTPLILAVLNTSLENARLLLDHKADVNAKDNEGNTPLMIAAEWYTDNSAMVRLLLERGADVNAVDKDGQTPLHKAAEENHLGSMRALLEYKANPNARDSKDETPLLAMRLGLPNYSNQAKPEHIELMLSHGADPNAADKDGNFALIKAIRGPDIKLVQALIDHGADVNKEYKYYDGAIHSLLWWTISNRDITSDRLDKEELSKVIKLLCDKGAALRGDEVTSAFSFGWHKLFSRKQIVSMLESNNEIVFTYIPDDPWMRKYVLRRIVYLSLYDISIAQDLSVYKAALSVCVFAKDRAEAWGLAGQCPEIYFDCGILAAKTGDTANAKLWLQKYLEMAPNAANGDKARALLIQ